MTDVRRKYTAEIMESEARMKLAQVGSAASDSSASPPVSARRSPPAALPDSEPPWAAARRGAETRPRRETRARAVPISKPVMINPFVGLVSCCIAIYARSVSRQGNLVYRIRKTGMQPTPGARCCLRNVATVKSDADTMR